MQNKSQMARLKVFLGQPPTPIKRSHDSLGVSLTPRELPQYKKASESSQQDSYDPGSRRNTTDPSETFSKSNYGFFPVWPTVIKQKKESQPQHEKTRHGRVRPKIVRDTENNHIRKTPFHHDGKTTPEHATLKKIGFRALTEMSESTYSSNKDTIDSEKNHEKPMNSSRLKNLKNLMDQNHKPNKPPLRIKNLKIPRKRAIECSESLSVATERAKPYLIHPDSTPSERRSSHNLLESQIQDNSISHEQSSHFFSTKSLIKKGGINKATANDCPSADSCLSLVNLDHGRSPPPLKSYYINGFKSNPQQTRGMTSEFSQRINSSRATPDEGRAYYSPVNDSEVLKSVFSIKFSSQKDKHKYAIKSSTLGGKVPSLRINDSASPVSSDFIWTKSHPKTTKNSQVNECLSVLNAIERRRSEKKVETARGEKRETKSILRTCHSERESQRPLLSNTSIPGTRRVRFADLEVSKRHKNLRVMLWTMTFGQLVVKSIKRSVRQKKNKCNKMFQESFQEQKQIFLIFAAEYLREPMLRLVKEKRQLYIVDPKAPIKEITDGFLRIHDFLMSLLESLMFAIESDKLPNSLYQALGSLIEPRTVLPDHYLSKYEINQLEFNQYGSIRNLNKERSMMLLGGYILLRMLINEVVMRPWQIFPKIPNGKVNFRNLLNAGSVFYHALYDVFKKITPNHARDSQASLRPEYRVKPIQASLPTDYHKGEDEPSQAFKSDEIADAQLASGFYPKMLLNNAMQHRPAMYQEIVNSIEIIMETLYKKTYREPLKDTQTHFGPYMTKARSKKAW